MEQAAAGWMNFIGFLQCWLAGIVPAGRPSLLALVTAPQGGTEGDLGEVWVGACDLGHVP